MDYGANIFQRLFKKLAILVLSRDIGCIMLHVTNLYDKSLIVTMRKLLNTFFFLRLDVKPAHHFFTIFFQCPKPGLYFKYFIRLLYNSSD